MRKKKLAKSYLVKVDLYFVIPAVLGPMKTYIVKLGFWLSPGIVDRFLWIMLPPY